MTGFAEIEARRYNQWLKRCKLNICAYVREVKVVFIQHLLFGMDAYDRPGDFLEVRTNFTSLKIAAHPPIRPYLILPSIAWPQLPKILLSGVKISNHTSVKRFF